MYVCSIAIGENDKIFWSKKCRRIIKVKCQQNLSEGSDANLLSFPCVGTLRSVKIARKVLSRF